MANNIRPLKLAYNKHVYVYLLFTTWEQSLAWDVTTGLQ